MNIQTSLGRVFLRPPTTNMFQKTLCKQLNTNPQSPATVAVLFQAIEPPIINGVRKPRKPGGYQDSGADIAYTLRSKGINITTPTPHPQESQHEGWCFPDTEEGISAAIARGATHLWANTILFNSHPLQASEKLTPFAESLRIIGQPPGLVEKFDDKGFLNAKLREMGGFVMPSCWMVAQDEDLDALVRGIDRYPVIGKPVRGRGSHGVKLCRDAGEVKAHVAALLDESPLVMVEEFLAGEEATITVMPPSAARPGHWSMLPVVRFNHAEGVAPYNGVVAVTANSRAVSEEECARDEAFGKAMRQCERVAEVIGATAPIRVDIRRFGEGTEFALFDINMKPNMTGPGRPGREEQASLTALAAAAMGWDYGALLGNMMESAQPLSVFRGYKSPF